MRDGAQDEVSRAPNLCFFFSTMKMTKDGARDACMSQAPGYVFLPPFSLLYRKSAPPPLSEHHAATTTTTRDRAQDATHLHI